MSRLIDADIFYDEQFARCDNSMPYIGTCTTDNSPLWKELYNAPTVDAVEVVRCKDCKYWKKFNKHGNNMCLHTNWLPLTVMERPYTSEEHFCGYGERKEYV